MGKIKLFSKLIKRTEGSVAIISALGLVAFLAVVSLAIDMGHLYTVRNELQNNADAAALAAAANLIQPDGAGGAVRDATLATQKAMQVAQRQSQISGQALVADADRTDLTITFGIWNINAGNPDTAWTEIGPTCSSSSSANAVKITLRRGEGTAYGPVTNLLAGTIGINTSEVAATATAYLGYTTEALTGAVQVPLTLPKSVITACRSHSSSWFARILGPREAVASTPKTYVFKDTGGGNVNTTVTSADPLDPEQAYLFTVGQNDSVPYTIWDILTKIYTPSYTSRNPVAVGDLKVGQKIYARSEFKYGSSYITPIFERLQRAYNYKKDSYGKWRVTLPVYGTTPNPSASRRQSPGLRFLARLLAPFSPTAAYACYTMPPPNIYVNDFVNVDITDVTYSYSCSDCNYGSFPRYINGVRYTSKLDCMKRYPVSCWNENTVTIENVTDSDTAPPAGGGTLSGGQPGENGTGAFASIPRLVK